MALVTNVCAATFRASIADAEVDVGQDHAAEDGAVGVGVLRQQQDPDRGDALGHATVYCVSSLSLVSSQTSLGGRASTLRRVDKPVAFARSSYSRGDALLGPPA